MGVAGAPDSQFIWQATNLVRSVDLFSSRPIVVVAYGKEFIAPASWQGMPNVIVYRMLPGNGHGVSFNFNKIRSMVSSRVIIGIQLDTDQIIAPGMDQLFVGTRREITATHPWPMLPVHWMSRDAKKPEPYWEYAFRDWSGPRSLRWGHAHPTWTFWALLFLGDLLKERLGSSDRGRRGQDIEVWPLEEAREHGVLEVLKRGRKAKRTLDYKPWMREDEDMLNVGLWRDNSRKDWCKYDLEPDLFKNIAMAPDLYYDKRWYPEGVPVVFISMHNTKAFELTDWLLSVVAKCDKERPALHCPWRRGTAEFCREGSPAELDLRRQPTKYASMLCCCLEPRQETKIYWGGEWFKRPEDVPKRLKKKSGKDRNCVFP